MARRTGGRPARPYDRTTRVGRLLREIVAEELGTVDDERLAAVSITGVDVDPEIRRAVVHFDSGDPSGAADPGILAALAEQRVALQQVINQQTHLRRTPELVFRPDEGVRAGSRVEAILRDLAEPDDDRVTSASADDGPTGDGPTGDGPAGESAGGDTPTVGHPPAAEHEG